MVWFTHGNTMNSKIFDFDDSHIGLFKWQYEVMHVTGLSTLFCEPWVLSKVRKQNMKTSSARIRFDSYIYIYVQIKQNMETSSAADLLHAIHQTCTNHTTYHKWFNAQNLIYVNSKVNDVVFV